jgi:hypothetical protein
MRGWLTRPLSLGTWFQIKNTITPLAVLLYLVAAVVIAAIIGPRLGLGWAEALLAGLLTALSMFLFECLHQYGHAWAARSVGYPMRGIFHFSYFSASIYPRDEPSLPPATHIRRALGGFWINLVVGLVFGLVAVWVWPLNTFWGWVTAATAFYNFVVLGLGALLPIDIPGFFTVDGGTILHYWREMHKQK